MVQSNLTDESVDLKWKPPTDNGGLPITHYVIEVREINRQTWSFMCEIRSSSTNYTVTGLVPGMQYFFRISAKNDEGQGPPLTSDQPARPVKAASECFDIEDILLNS